jgi:hypothetical protein
MTKAKRPLRPISGRRAAGLSAAATLVVQVAVLALVPAGARLAVSLVMLTAWMAALWLVVLTASRRRRRAARRTGPATTDTAKAPSPQPQAALHLAQHGATSEQIAATTGLPLPLAELLVADAQRGDAPPGDAPQGQGPQPG